MCKTCSVVAESQLENAEIVSVSKDQISSSQLLNFWEEADR